uniref:Uncharacterized protein n=1 Tax=Anguilla anguilla TaxID=7936 RepID=A0A0E9S3I5_ANGAN
MGLIAQFYGSMATKSSVHYFDKFEKLSFLIVEFMP